MTRKEQNKVLDDKIESNNNQYKIDRLNTEISAFSSVDLNKYELLTEKDLKYKPNVLDKAKFEFSPLGKTFSTGLDKTAQGYQEEGVTKLLKGIRDGLAGGNRPNGNVQDRPDDRPNRPDDRPDGALGSVFLNDSNTNINDIQSNGEYYARLKVNQNAAIKKLEEEIKDKKLTKDKFN